MVWGASFRARRLRRHLGGRDVGDHTPRTHPLVTCRQDWGGQGEGALPRAWWQEGKGEEGAWSHAGAIHASLRAPRRAVEVVEEEHHLCQQKSGSGGEEAVVHPQAEGKRG